MKGRIHMTTDKAIKPSQRLKTTLSIHPDWNISDEQKKIYKQLHNQLPRLEKNQISIHNFGAGKKNGNCYITAFISNTTNRTMTLEKTPFLLLGPNGEKLGKKSFDLGAMGDIPPMTSRPWSFIFRKEDLLTENLPTRGFKLLVDRKKHRINFDESWRSLLSNEDSSRLKEAMKKLPPLKSDELNVTGLTVDQTKESHILATILIRSGLTKPIKIKQLPLYLEDATGSVIAKATFSFEDFEVGENSTKPLAILFPKETISAKDMDLSRWKIYTKGS